MPSHRFPPVELPEEVMEGLVEEAKSSVYGMILELLDEEQLISTDFIRLDKLKEATEDILHDFFVSHGVEQAEQGAFERSVPLLEVWCPWIVQIHNRDGTNWGDIYPIVDGDVVKSLPEALEEIMVESWIEFHDKTRALEATHYNTIP